MAFGASPIRAYTVLTPKFAQCAVNEIPPNSPCSRDFGVDLKSLCIPSGQCSVVCRAVKLQAVLIILLTLGIIVPHT